MDLHYSPYDFGIQDDPYPVYARLREEAPVYRNDADDIWVLSRHADIAEALRDTARYSSRNGLRIEPAFWGPQAERFFSFVAMDPPKHTRMRGLVSRAFTQRRVQALEPRLREIARGYLKPALDGERFDLMADFAARFPTDVISELVGVPEADRDRVRDLGMAIMYRDEEDTGPVTDLPPQALQAIGELVGYYTQLTIDRAGRRQDDLLSGLLDAADGDDKLSPEEIVGVLILLVGAGIETTMLLLGNAWHAAWKHPEQRAAALGGRIDDWIEETLRYDPPSQSLARTTTEDVELHGVRIPADSRVLLLVGSGNRDPRVFTGPDRFDLDRDTGASLSFGGGRHHCLGANLGRLEARVAFQELAAVVADYEIDDDAAQRVHSTNDRGFASLPTRITARR
ncbi:cytochrome P450 [Actinomadura macrotermitis]|uniref:Putative cytochrome P450 123 n=1 Tax=Actinomadura macrotermitis TaxID=2585200 RepID=A0A7K0C202_9ACTN|nr:cytochrome P450 [Actinomadura macrotermitis]MQY07386.1 putative cytochrome P450 123 [Actinomadura macrotermitis]